MEIVLDIGCKVCHMPRPLSENGLCGLCESLCDIVRDKVANKPCDLGHKPRGRRPHCRGCGKTCELDIEPWS
jgi:hypothetical protein